MAYGDDAVSRELVFLNASAPLVAAVGQVRYGRPRSTPSTRVAWLRRERVAEVRVTTALVMQVHDMLLTVRWPWNVANATATQFGSEASQSGLDDAVAVVMETVRGPVLDSTHGGAFASVPDDMEQFAILVSFDEINDELGNEYQEVAIRYRAVDHQITG